MVDPGHVPHVLDVDDHVVQGRARLHVRRHPGPKTARHRIGIAGVQRLQPRLLGRPRGAPGPHRLADEAGHKGHHHHAAVLRHHAQHGVRHVARVIGHRARRGVGKDHRRFGHPHGVQHGLFGHMAQVHHHAQPVHLTHHLFAEGVQPAPFRRVRRAVGPGRGGRVGQGHVARARVMELAQQPQRIVDGVAALHAGQAGDAPAPVHALDVVGGVGQFEHVGVGADQPLDAVDLLERRLGRLHGREACGHIDRPELGAHAALTQARDVGVQGRGIGALILRQINRVRVIPEPLPQGPGQVVVTVDQRAALQDAPRPRLSRRVLRQHGRSQHRDRGGGEKKGSDHAQSS